MRATQRGLTLIELMIAIAIFGMMMALAWRTIANTSEARRKFERYEERNHELRMALSRIAADFEAGYISKNEDTSASHPRTMMIARPGSKVPDVHFSTLGHRPMWADANESEQTVIWYLAHKDALSQKDQNVGQIDLVRREQRRPSNLPPEEEPSDFDVLVHDIQSLKIEFFNWKTLEWQETWDTTQSDGQKGWLPSRVRITITVRSLDERDLKLSTQARIGMQEAEIFVP